MNRANRVLWTVIGFLLVAVGVLGVLAHRGWLPGVQTSQPVLTPAAIQRWHGWGDWAIAATVVAGLIVSACGVLLLVAQLRRRRALTGEPVVIGGPEGRTHVAGTALQHAIASDLQTDRQVRRATVQLQGSPPSPRLRLQLALTGDADMGELQDRIDGAVARFRTTSGLAPQVTEVVVTLSNRQPQRVH